MKPNLFYRTPSDADPHLHDLQGRTQSHATRNEKLLIISAKAFLAVVTGIAIYELYQIIWR